jgi:hypothetical protein
VIRDRLEQQLAEGRVVLPAAVEFWNRTVGS